MRPSARYRGRPSDSGWFVFTIRLGLGMGSRWSNAALFGSWGQCHHCGRMTHLIIAPTYNCGIHESGSAFGVRAVTSVNVPEYMQSRLNPPQLVVKM
jgi:hypothetical protein